MRKIDHTKAYSEDDIAFLRQAGTPYFLEYIRINAEKFGYDPDAPEVPQDAATRTVIGHEGGQGNGAPAIDPATSAPRLVDPLGASTGDVDTSDIEDDYDKWKVPELEADVAARNAMENTTDVEVIGTGKDGNVTKSDLIKGLRLWDAQNPGALDSDED